MTGMTIAAGRPISGRSRNNDWKMAGGKRVPAPIGAAGLSAQYLLQQVLDAYDLAGVGLGIADSDGQLVHCNLAAQAILEQRDGLEMTPARTLRTRRGLTSPAHGLFEAIRDEAPENANQPGRVAIHAVPRPSGKRPLTVIVHFVGASDGSQFGASPATLVFIVDPELPMQGMESHVRGVCGFTAAETELAMLLMQGKSLAQCCEEMEIRRPTAASHLRQLFNKTQARTQSQLVSALFRRFGMLRSGASAQKPGVTGYSAGLVHTSAVVRDQSAESFKVSFIRR
jgi:DNA-binding CsgD family transcriptional regulator